MVVSFAVTSVDMEEGLLWQSLMQSDIHFQPIKSPTYPYVSCRNALTSP